MTTESLMTKIAGMMIGVGIFMALGVAAAHAYAVCC
jgi:hypothetical protein